MVVMYSNARKLDARIAKGRDVQNHLNVVLFEARVRAEEDLRTHKFDGHSFIEVEKNRADRFLILNDTRGQRAAMSIEYGRQAYVVKDEDGNVIREVGSMRGLYILHNALDVKKKTKKRLRVVN